MHYDLGYFDLEQKTLQPRQLLSEITKIYRPRKPFEIVPKIAPLMLAVSATLLHDAPNSLTTSC